MSKALFIIWIALPLFLIAIFFTCEKKASDRTALMQFHRSLFVADTHCDTPLRLLRGVDISRRLSSGHLDIPRMRAGGVDCQVFAIWTNPKKDSGSAGWNEALEMIENVKRVIHENQKDLQLCLSVAEVEQANAAGKIAIMLGVEGGQIIDHHLDYLDTLYTLGVRYITITWNYSQDWASAAIDENQPGKLKQKGLNEFGRQVIQRMNQLGMMIDVSHAGEKTFWDIYQLSQQPFIASHSCVYTLAKHFRNLKDDQIKALARKGGVIFINYYSGYLDEHFEERFDSLITAQKNALDSLRKSASSREEYRRLRKEFLTPYIKEFNPSIERIIDHIEYVANLVGVDYVGIGSDFDGISILPTGMEDVTSLPEITRLLLERGFSREDVRKIMGENFKRVFRMVTG